MRNRIAFCTDFSVASDVAIKSAFYVMDYFKFDVDIIHLVEEDSVLEKDRLKKYHRELLMAASRDHGIGTLLFEKGDISGLLKHLNATDYYLVVMGIQGLGGAKYWGSFVSSVYENTTSSIILVPFDHRMKKDERCLITVEYKNLEQLFLLRKERGHLIQFGIKPRLIVLSDRQTSVEKETVNRTLALALPGVTFQTTFVSNEGLKKDFYNELRNPDLDLYYYFRDDLFDQTNKAFYKSISVKDHTAASMIRKDSDPELVSLFKSLALQKAKAFQLSLIAN